MAAVRRRETSFDLGERAYQILDLGTNLTGFLGARIDCRTKTRLWFVFDEILGDDGDVNFRRLGCCNIVEYELEPGSLRARVDRALHAPLPASWSAWKGVHGAGRPICASTPTRR